MNKITIPIIFVILGVILILAGLGSQSLDGDTSFSLIGGVNFLLGAVMYRSRKNQAKKKSINWLVVEIVSLILIILTVLPSLMNGLWYLHPITFLFSPVLIFGCYIYAFLKFKKQISSVNN